MRTQEPSDLYWSQEKVEKALADQRRNLCEESDTLIEQLKQSRDSAIKAWNSAIDSVLALYAPDGNPYVWRSKIERLRQNENMPQLVKEPDQMGICPACGANTDSWHFCHDYGTWK